VNNRVVSHLLVQYKTIRYLIEVIPVLVLLYFTIQCRIRIVHWKAHWWPA